MTLNPDVVRARATEIEEALARPERFAPVPIEEFISNQDSTDIACYRLLIAIEAALALCYHVSARLLRQTPEDYAACFSSLRDGGVIPAGLAERLQRMARFRNLLIR